MVVSRQQLLLLEDLLGPSRTWPSAIRMMLLSYGHLNNSQRFAATVFLLGNGINPRLIEEFYASRFNFDAAAWRQVQYVIRMFPTSNWTYWDVNLGRTYNPRIDGRVPVQAINHRQVVGDMLGRVLGDRTQHSRRRRY